MIKKIALNDSGESLIEVVISAVILSLIGLLLVSSIATAKPFADKMSLMGDGVSVLNNAAEAVNVQTFAHCTPTSNEPYSLSLPTTPVSTSVTGFAITSNELPPVIAGSNLNYQFKIQTQNTPSQLTWAVEPPLPAGITLDPNTGVISGKTNSPITSQYVFTASNGSVKATKTLTFSSILVQVLLNNGSTWVDCSLIPLNRITSAAGDGKTQQYATNIPTLVNKGNLVTIWGAANSAFDGASLFVSDQNSNIFTVLGTAKSTSSNGYAGLSKQVDVQQVVLSTLVSGTPIKKIVVKSVA